MLSPFWMTIAIAVITGASIFLFIMLTWLLRQHRKLKRDYADLADIVHGLNNDFRDLYTAAQSMDERVIATDLKINALVEQMNRLAEQINAFQQPESSNHPYGVAIQKVRSGASVSELMQTAGLSQDEAALLIRLHGSKTP